jgi:hypothetical protein
MVGDAPSQEHPSLAFPAPPKRNWALITLMRSINEPGQEPPSSSSKPDFFEANFAFNDEAHLP